MSFQALTGWRGVGAIMIAVFHFSFVTHFYDLQAYRPLHLLVDMFFVLSGLVISQGYFDRINTRRELASFGIRRFGRIWPLHAVVLCGFIAVEGLKFALHALLGAEVNHQPFAAESSTPAYMLPSQFLLLHAVGFHDRLTWNIPSWSLSAEWWTYLLAGVIFYAFPKWRTATLTLIGIFCAALMTPRLGPYDLDFTYDLGVPRAIYGFALGHLVYVARERLKQPTTLRFGTALEIAAIAAVGIFHFAATGTPIYILAPAFVALLVYVFSYEAGALSRVLKARPLQALGLWSYSIYVVHALVLFVLGLSVSFIEHATGADLWREFPLALGPSRAVQLDSLWLADAALIGYVAVVVFLSAMTYRYIEEPSRKLFNALADRAADAKHGVKLRRGSQVSAADLGATGGTV